MKKPTNSAADVTPQTAAPSPKLSKLDQILALVSQPDGAGLAEMCAATGWQTHSVRRAKPRCRVL